MKTFSTVIIVLFIVAMTESNGYTNWFDIIAIIDKHYEEHKSINHTNIISKYLSIRNDERIVLDHKIDSCVQLRLLNNTDSPVESKKYILFMYDFNQLNNCDGLQFNVISEYHLFSQSHSFQIMYLKLSNHIKQRKSMRRLLSNTWITSTSSLLPRADSGMAIGYYNNTIYMFGGDNYSNDNQITEYDIATDTMIDQGLNKLSINVWGRGQYYTQIDRLMYWIDGDSGSNISVYDLQNKQFSAGQITDIPTTVTSFGCLASSSSDNLLFVVGGYNGFQTLVTLQVFNLSSDEWFSGPDMNRARCRHACIVDPKHNKLYAIGGTLTYNGDGTSFVETILVTDILSDLKSTNLVGAQWSSNPPLFQDIMYPIAVLRTNYIYIIGGVWYCSALNCPYYKLEKAVQIINCNDGSVTVGPRLNYAIYLPAAINVNHKIYVFGGVVSVSRDASRTNTDKWQYMDLLINTTTSPTTILTTLSGKYGIAGDMFDLCTKRNIEITSFDIHCSCENSAPKTVTTQIYVASAERQTYHDIKDSSTEWTLIHDQQVNCAGYGYWTTLSAFNQNSVLPHVMINKTCRGFYVTLTINSGCSLVNNDGYSEGDVYVSDPALDVKVGIGVWYSFQDANYGGRLWNGQIHYNMLPTLSPTYNPTKAPTQYPTAPTDNPADTPTHYPSDAITSTTTYETRNGRNNQHNHGKPSAVNPMTATIIIISILLCYFIIIMVFMLYSKRRKQQQRQKTEEQMEKHIEMPPTSTASSPSPSNKSVNRNIENDIDITQTSYVTPGLHPTAATTVVGVKEPDDLSLYRSEGRKTQSKFESTVMLEMININSNKNEPLIEENINPMYGNENENDNGLWGNNNNTATGMDGENVNDDEKEKVLLEGILSDIMEMDDLDPNKIHQIHVNNIEHKENNESESEASDNMYEKSESNNENSMIHQDVVTAGGEEYKDDNGEQLLDGMLSDIMNMDDLDPNKIHQMHVNNGVNKQMNNESDSDDSDNMYQQSERNNTNIATADEVEHENDNNKLQSYITTTGEEEHENDNGEQLLDGMQSDIMKFDDLDENKIHLIQANNGANKQMNNQSDSDDSDNMYE